MSKPQCRSVYVGQLRRAFLMRAHPDRFRNRADAVRQSQSALLQALGARMTQPDFVDYTRNEPQSRFSGVHEESHTFFLEKRDGSLLKSSMRMDESVDRILGVMADALKQSGAASMPPPPPFAEKSSSSSSQFKPKSDQEILWASADPSSPGINRRFDINTMAGRDLPTFLQTLRRDDVEERRASRMDVSAAALVARRLYSFQAIDGTGLKWSSGSFQKLLQSFIALHEEHHTRFHVDSFYPFRLVFSLDEFHDPLDLHGGILFLNPTQTNIQMLEVLRRVTPETLEQLVDNRRLLQQHLVLAESQLGIRIKKGHSCSSAEYYDFLQDVYDRLSKTEFGLTVRPPAASSLTTEPIRVTVESTFAMRRSRVSSNGDISVPAGMPFQQLLQTLDSLSASAAERRADDLHLKQSIRDVVKSIQWSAGLQKVFRTGIVENREYLECLLRLQQHADSLKEWLSGHSLGVAGRGHFCSLGDDGSIMVPVDWRVS